MAVLAIAGRAEHPSHLAHPHAKHSEAAFAANNIAPANKGFVLGLKSMPS